MVWNVISFEKAKRDVSKPLSNIESKILWTGQFLILHPSIMSVN